MKDYVSIQHTVITLSNPSKSLRKRGDNGHELGAWIARLPASDTLGTNLSFVNESNGL